MVSLPTTRFEPAAGELEPRSMKRRGLFPFRSEPLAAASLACVLLLFVVNLTTGYLNSWLVFVPVPSIGSVFRDFLFGLLLLVFLYYFLMYLAGRRVFFNVAQLWAFVAVYGLCLVPFAPEFFPAALGFRNIFYPLAAVTFLTVLSFSPNAIRSALALRSLAVYAFSLAALCGVIDFAMGGEFIKMLGFNPEYNDQVAQMVRSHLGITRANAGVADALNYGYLMAFAFVFFYYLMSQKCSATQRAAIVIGFVFSGLACLLSMTRGAILALGLAGLAYVLYRSPLRAILLTLFLVVVGSLYLTEIEYGQIMLDRFSESDAGSSKSSSERVDAVVGALVELNANPLIGQGLGTQGAATGYQVTDRRIATDNSFFWIMLETGIVGFVCMLAAYLYMLHFLFSRRRHGEYRAFVVTAALVLVVAAVLSSAPVSPTLAIPFWLILVSESFIPAAANKPGTQNRKPLKSATA